MCEISKPAWEKNQHKLYSVHRFLSCLVLGPGITSEETSIRYAAFVWFFFFFFFFFKKLFPSTFSLPHTHKIPHRRELQVKEGLAHHTGLAGVLNLWLCPGQPSGSVQ